MMMEYTVILSLALVYRWGFSPVGTLIVLDEIVDACLRNCFNLKQFRKQAFFTLVENKNK
jgi:hypothetical protein